MDTALVVLVLLQALWLVMEVVVEKVTKQGWLQKQGSINSSNWKWRYFIVSGNTLLRFSKFPGSPKGILSLVGVSVKDKSSGKKFCFSITDVNGKEMLFLASYEKEFLEWMNAMKFASGSVPLPVNLRDFPGYVMVTPTSYILYPKTANKAYQPKTQIVTVPNDLPPSRPPPPLPTKEPEVEQEPPRLYP